MTFSMCLPHLHPFWVNQKKRKRSAGKKCAIHSKVKTGEASCVPTLRIALMRSVHGRKSCFRKREAQTSEHGKAKKGRGTKVPVHQQRHFLGTQQRHIHSGPEIFPKHCFFTMSTCRWVDANATISLTLLLKKIQTFKGKVFHFCSVSIDG